jgi:hypothetical protein
MGLKLTQLHWLFTFHQVLWNQFKHKLILNLKYKHIKIFEDSSKVRGFMNAHTQSEYEVLSKNNETKMLQ